MNRNLITQIKNEGRDNLWLIVEFTIVAVVVWLLTASLYTMLKTKYTEKGFDITDVYKVSIRAIPDNNPAYDNEADNIEDQRTLLANIRKSPYVEVAGFSYNALPYNYSYLGNSLKFINLGDSLGYNGNLRMGSPEMVRVLGLKSTDGTSQEQLEAMLRKGDVLISPAISYQYQGVSEVTDFIGKEVYCGDTVRVRHVAGIIESIRRSEYEKAQGIIFVPLDEATYDVANAWEIAVRVKPGMGKRFEDEFYATSGMRRMRNIYLSQLKSMSAVRTVIQNGNDTTLRLMCAGIAFLLIIIYLGLLGTFWFRIRQRTHEIALRKTCGATSGNIFRRIISEGLLLLSISLVPAIIIGIGVIYFALNKNQESFLKIDWWHYGVSFGITAVMMAIIIIIGVFVPARRAMSIEPAIALKEE